LLSTNLILVFSKSDNFDNIYQVTNAYNITKDLSSVGLGTTTIRRVEFVQSGIGSTNFSSTSIFFDSSITTWDDQAGAYSGLGSFFNERIYW